MLTGREDIVQILTLLLVQVAEDAFEHDLGEADDRVERRPQLMGLVRGELGLVAIGGLELAALLLDLVEETHVLHRDARLIGERLRELDLAVGERSRRDPTNSESADHLLVDAKWDADDRTRAGHLERRGLFDEIRVRRQIIDADQPAGGVDPAHERATLAYRTVQRSIHLHSGEAIQELGGRRPSCCEPKGVTGTLGHPRDVRTDEPPGVLDDRAERRLQVEDGATDGLEDIADGGLPFQRLLGLVEETDVLERDRRLPRERLRELDLSLSERHGLAATHDDDAERLASTNERRGQHGPLSVLHAGALASGVLVARGHVVSVHRAHLDHRPAGYRFTVDWNADRHRDRAVVRNWDEIGTAHEKYGRVLGGSESRRALVDCVKDRVRGRRRGGDDALDGGDTRWL